MIDELMDEATDRVRLRPTDRLWSIFAAHRISFGARGPRDLPFLEMLKNARIEPYADFTNGRVLYTMGAFSYQMTGEAVLSVGRYCSIADHTSVLGERHPVEHVTTSTFPYRTPRPSFRWAREDLLGGRPDNIAPTVRTKAPPVLEHDVWIGNNVLLQRGVTLHTGCVVGAGAVVTKDVPPYAIVGGNPARLLRPRFSEDIAARLLASRWWDYHPRSLFDFGSNDPSRFLDRFEAERATLERFSPAALSWQLLAELLQPC